LSVELAAARRLRARPRKQVGNLRRGLRRDRARMIHLEGETLEKYRLSATVGSPIRFTLPLASSTSQQIIARVCRAVPASV
jgi:hypothetical protein